VHEKFLDAGGEVVDGEVDDNNFRLELDFEPQPGTKFK
jgi:hypothetical protein